MVHLYRVAGCKVEAAALFGTALSTVAEALRASPRLHPDHFPRDTGEMM